MPVAALKVVRAWYRAAEAFDADALAAVSHDDFEWVTIHRGTQLGHGALTDWVQRQSYGVALHIEPQRYFQRGNTVVAETRTEWRYVDGGELAQTSSGAAVFEVRDDRVARLLSHDDLASALASTGLTEADLARPAPTA